MPRLRTSAPHLLVGLALASGSAALLVAIPARGVERNPHNAPRGKHFVVRRIALTPLGDAARHSLDIAAKTHTAWITSAGEFRLAKSRALRARAMTSIAGGRRALQQKRTAPDETPVLVTKRDGTAGGLFLGNWGVYLTEPEPDARNMPRRAPKPDGNTRKHAADAVASVRVEEGPLPALRRIVVTRRPRTPWARPGQVRSRQQSIRRDDLRGPDGWGNLALAVARADPRVVEHVPASVDGLDLSERR
jgi:hypothetical protein